MPAQNKRLPGITANEAARQLLKGFPMLVVLSWLNEFGYTNPDVVDGLEQAVIERGPRITRELEVHRERAAARATMGRGRITGRSSVIA